MSNNFLGEVRMFGGSFAPRTWAFCNGQLMSIAQNSALFTLLGTSYGGDGVTTFGLPNLQGRLPVGQGSGAGLTPREIGETSGTETVVLQVGQLPSHNHSLQSSTLPATTATPGQTVLPAVPTPANGHFYTIPGTPTPTMSNLIPYSCGQAGSSMPHSNLMPSLCVSFIIALEGIFPSRN